MGVTAQALALCLRGTPEDAEHSAAPLTPPLSGATQWLLSINLSLEPPRSPLAQEEFPPRLQPTVDAPRLRLARDRTNELY